MNEVERGLFSLVMGYRIRELRKKQNMSQSTLAEGIGSQSMISLLESGRQFPMPDVLTLIAQRLDDETLLHYAKLVSSGEVSWTDFVCSNRELVIEILASQRGRWHDTQLRISLQLCENCYDNKLFRIVREICLLILEHSTSQQGHAQAYFYYGSSYLFTHEYEDAEHWLLKAEQEKNMLDESMRGRLYYNLGYAYSEQDVYGTALWYAKMASDNFRRLNDYLRHAKSQGLLGVVQARMGRLEDASQTLELAYNIMDKWGMSGSDRARVAVSLADVNESLGNLHSAEQWCRRAIELNVDSLDPDSLCAVYQILSLVYLAREEMSKATSAVRRAMDIAKDTSNPRSVSHVYLLAAGILPVRRERIEAASCAYETARESKHLIEQALAADCLAALYSRERPSTAQEYQRIAVKSYREHLAQNTMFRSAFRYLPIHQFHES